MDNAAAVRTARIAACPTTNVARNLPLVRELWTKMFVQPGGPVEGGETPRQALPENSLRNSASKFLAMYANISGDCAVAALRGAFGRAVYRTAGHFCTLSTQQCLCPEITPHSSIIIDATRQTGKLAFFIP
ncbi:hypothetical protein Bra1253DRAFT_05875 [Bradyrhizobium sp. WSM1253]|nr:hypothetical protein Bra1253DRAFT_05875 [Bradyrhizobium sp. WSM1253]